MTASNYDSTIETTNFARISRLLLDVCADVLRDVLIKRIPLNLFSQAIQQRKRNLLSALNAEQKRILFPPGGFQGTYEIYDVSMLYVLLRNIGNITPHINGWGVPPESSDRSLSANIERIRLARNEVYGHVTTAAIDDVEYNTIWMEIKQVIAELETSMLTGNLYKDAVEKLESEEMDSETAKMYADILHNMNIQEKETKTFLVQHEKLLQTMSTTGACTQQEVSQLKSDMEGMREHLQKIDTTGTCTQQEVSKLKMGMESMGDLLGKIWSKLEISKNTEKRTKLIGKSALFIERILGQTDIVKTSAYGIVMEHLVQNSWAVITGMPGNGKTTLACHVMHDIANDKAPSITSKTPLIISKPSDFEDVVSPSDNLIIFIDNMFGTYSLSDVKEWVQWLKESVYTTSDVQDPRRNLLLVALRTEIYKECLPLVKHHPLFQSLVDLTRETNLTTDDKLAILRKCSTDHQFTAEEENSIMMTSNFIGFPQCCTLFKNDKQLQKRGSKFFERPIYFLNVQLQEMWSIESIKFSALALVMMNGGKIHEKAFESSVRMDMIKTICRINSSENIVKQCIHAARSLVGTYLFHDGTSFTFSHDSIHHAVATVLWNDNCKEVIQNCSVDFLPNIYAVDAALNQFDVVVIQEFNYPILAGRLMKEINTKHSISYKTVSAIKVWDDSQFCVEMDTLTFSDQPNCYFNWEQKDEQNHSILYHAVATRNVSFVQYLFTKSPSQVNCNNALNVACEINDLYLFQLCWDNHAQIDIETLFSAVKGGNEDIFKRIIEIYFEISIKHKSKSDILDVDCTILQEICRQNKSSLLKLSIEKIGIELFRRCISEQILLQNAAAGGSLDIVKCLIGMGADVYQLGLDDNTSVLHQACYFGHYDLVQYLASHYESLLSRLGIRNCTPLIFLAAGTGSLDIAKYLIHKGVNVYAKDDNGETVLHSACNRGHLDLVKYVCDCYSDLIHVLGETNSTMLHYTAWGTGSVDVAKYLISRGLNVYEKDDNGETVLHLACSKGHFGLVKYLCDHYCDLMQVTGESNTTLLHYVAWGSGCLDTAKYLISKGVNVYKKDDNDETAVHLACNKGHLGLVKYLCDHYSDLMQVPGESNTTLLHYVSWGTGSLDIAKYLISKGVNVYKRDDNDETALHLACNKGHLGLVRHLCDHYSDLVWMPGESNTTLLHYTAWGSGSVDVATYLISKGVNVHEKDDNDETVLHLACSKGHLDLVKHICERYPELIQVPGKSNATPLHNAAWGSGSVDVVSYLISKGVNVYKKDANGETLLHLACIKGHLSLVKFLCERYPHLIQVPDESNSTLSQYITLRTGSVDVASFLMSKGVNVFEKEDNGYTLLPVGTQLILFRHTL